MRYLAVLFFVLLTEKSFAKWSCKSCCSNTTLNVTRPLAIYQRAIDSIMVPTLEVGDQWAANFKKATTKAIVDYSLYLTENLHSEAIDAGRRLVEDIEKDHQRLRQSIKSIDSRDTSPICLDRALKKLTDQLWIFLKLKPGLSTTECPVLPDLPPQPIEFKSRTKKRTAEELFLNFDLTSFSIMRQLYGYMNHVYLASWKGGMPVYEILRIQFYDEILNCSVMCAYREVVDEVYGIDELIRCSVSRRAWMYFKDARDRVVKVSNDYCDSLERKKDQNETIHHTVKVEL